MALDAIILNSIKNFYEGAGFELGPKCCAATTVNGVAMLALFVIGCMGAAGTFPGAAIGWVTVGLGGGAFLFNLASTDDFKRRKLDLIAAAVMAAILVTVGTLGGMGMLSTAQVGWGIVGTGLAFMPVNCVISCIKKSQAEGYMLEKQRAQAQRQW